MHIYKQYNELLYSIIRFNTIRYNARQHEWSFKRNCNTVQVAHHDLALTGNGQVFTGNWSGVNI